jgi:hypothetical protein
VGPRYRTQKEEDRGMTGICDTEKEAEKDKGNTKIHNTAEEIYRYPDRDT